MSASSISPGTRAATDLLLAITLSSKEGWINELEQDEEELEDGLDGDDIRGDDEEIEEESEKDDVDSDEVDDFVEHGDEENSEDGDE